MQLILQSQWGGKGNCCPAGTDFQVEMKRGSGSGGYVGGYGERTSSPASVQSKQSILCYAYFP